MLNGISTFDIYIAMTFAFITASVVMEIGYAILQRIPSDE